MNLKDTYINFFIERNHKFIPSAPVIPENDASVLFNTAGMQPLVPYLMGQPHPEGTRLCDVQKCVRTNDLDEIGDTTHHTFFEMLGNWSLGDYFKEESITWSYELLTKYLNIPKERLAVTIYAGSDDIPYDKESYEIWRNLGIEDSRIAALDDNFWIAGDAGLCGPDTEIFYWRANEEVPTKFDPEDERWVEIWNTVFMQYNKDTNGNITELPHKNVDTGMGVERVTAVLEGKLDNYESSIWSPIISKIEELSNLKYEDDNKRPMRIIADHMRAITIISGDDAKIYPSNKDQGYILRRLIRRVIRYAKRLNIDINSDFDIKLANLIIDSYKKYYPELERNRDHIIEVLTIEKKKFGRTLEKGLREFDKLVRNGASKIDGTQAFHLYDTYGFPIELTIEECSERNLEVDVEGFKKKFQEHQEKSRAGSTQKFKGGLAGNSEIETKYHTATHLLNAALKVVINKDTHQRGSNITSERMRFDFNCDHKLTPEEKTAVEDLVNKWIKDDLKVVKEEMSKEDAVKSGAECMFIEKYPDLVTVYSIGDVSKELCGGPHVEHTNVLGHFKIKKEEASSAGVRRIKAILED